MEMLTVSSKPDGTMPHVGVPCLIRRVEIEVDNVVEHSNGHRHCFLEQLFVKNTAAYVLRQVDRPKVANGSLILGRVECDLCA